MSIHTQLPATGTTPLDDPVRQGLADPEVERTLKALIRAALGQFRTGIASTQVATEAQDMLQEVAVQALASAHGFDPERGSLVHWLGGIVWNLARKRRRAPYDATEPAMLEETVFDRGSPIPDEVAHRIDSREILEHLPFADAQMLKWHAEGWTAPEIAEKLNLTSGNVRVRLSCLKRRLRGLSLDTNLEADHD